MKLSETQFRLLKSGPRPGLANSAEKSCHGEDFLRNSSSEAYYLTELGHSQGEYGDATWNRAHPEEGT